MIIIVPADSSLMERLTTNINKAITRLQRKIYLLNFHKMKQWSIKFVPIPK